MPLRFTSHQNAALRHTFRRDRYKYLRYLYKHRGVIARGVGGVFAAGAANLFTRVPKLDTMPIVRKRPNTGSHYRRALPGAKRVRQEDPIKRDDATKGGTFQYTSKRLRGGRSMSARKRMAKLIKTEMQPVIYRFSGINIYSGSSGMFRMWNYINTTTVGSNEHKLPLHLYDITSIVNANGSAAQHTPIGYEYNLKENAGTPLITNDIILGSNQLGGDYAQGSIMIEKSQQGTTVGTTPLPGAKGMMDWMDLRMMLYGMSGTLTKFKIALIQFNDEDFCPGGTKPSTATVAYVGGASANTFDSNIYRFWQEYMRPWVFSPIAAGTGIGTKPFKILKNYDVVLNPRLTTAGDTDTPSVHEVRLFQKFNRMSKFMWELTSTGTAGSVVNDGYNIVDTNSEALPYVHPKARIYLMIVSNAKYNSGASAVPTFSSATTANSPSYDLLIRTKYTKLEDN